VNFTDDNYTGIELDLDCVENVLSSAITPSGISTINARQYLSFTSQRSKVAYLHICEGATRLEDGRQDEGTGKLIGYLVADFIKG
jgi:formiminoglutamase